MAKYLNRLVLSNTVNHSRIIVNVRSSHHKMLSYFTKLYCLYNLILTRKITLNRHKPFTKEPMCDKLPTLDQVYLYFESRPRFQ